jgi:16S rRNA G527 N7-methylase RsmG
MTLRIDAAAITTALTPFHAITPEVSARIATWTDVLDRWSRAQRLVGWRTAAELLDKGIADVWMARAALGAHPYEQGIDVGSGSGLPGLLLAAEEPTRPFHLVESRRKRAAFLREAARAMGLDAVVVHHGRAAQVRTTLGLKGELLFVSRAFASPADALAEAAAWNAGAALVSTSRARLEAGDPWPPAGWRAADGNFRHFSGPNVHELVIRIAD